MLIPNAKFLALPSIALAVIVALAMSRPGAIQAGQAMTAPAKVTVGCGTVRVAAHCIVAADSTVVVVR